MIHLRLLSAIIGIPLILGLVYLGDPYFAVFALVIANLGMREYTAMLKNKGFHLPVAFGYVGVTLIVSAIYLEPFLEQNLVFPAALILLMALSLLFLFYFEKADFGESALIFWGIIYLGGLSGYLILLRRLPEGLILTFLLFAGVWISDSLAYFTGIRWGRRRLAPAISPNKSLEGALCATAGTPLLFFLTALLFPELIGFTPVESALLGLAISIFGQLGDLVESAMKRYFAVKDTGNLIPGHGGVLDRFDSLLFVAPVLFYFAQMLF